MVGKENNGWMDGYKYASFLKIGEIIIWEISLTWLILMLLIYISSLLINFFNKWKSKKDTYSFRGSNERTARQHIEFKNRSSIRNTKRDLSCSFILVAFDYEKQKPKRNQKERQRKLKFLWLEIETVTSSIAKLSSALNKSFWKFLGQFERARLYRTNGTFHAWIETRAIHTLDTIRHYLSMHAGTGSIVVQDQQQQTRDRGEHASGHQTKRRKLFGGKNWSIFEFEVAQAR